MSQPTFDGDVIGHGGHLILNGSSAPEITIYPRTIGGIIQESGVVDRTVSLQTYIIPPPSATRGDVENYFNLLNELIGVKEADLQVNDNTYIDANVKSIDYDKFITNKFTKYVVNFQLNDQDTGSTVRQLTVPEIVGFTRGRPLRFKTVMDDNSERTFTFWHNFDNIRNFETQVTVKPSNQFGGSSRVIRVGGFEKHICSGWIIGPNTINNRRNIEAYFYNIINGPLGKIGTLYLSDGRIIYKAFLSDFSMEDSSAVAVKYELTFIVSLQC